MENIPEKLLHILILFIPLYLIESWKNTNMIVIDNFLIHN